ncbi:hypothetical protein L0Y41_01565 [bacterium]|nr:hypothetical protein [bacterium]
MENAGLLWVAETWGRDVALITVVLLGVLAGWLGNRAAEKINNGLRPESLIAVYAVILFGILSFFMGYQYNDIARLILFGMLGGSYSVVVAWLLLSCHNGALQTYCFSKKSGLSVLFVLIYLLLYAVMPPDHFESWTFMIVYPLFLEPISK